MTSRIRFLKTKSRKSGLKTILFVSRVRARQDKKLKFEIFQEQNENTKNIELSCLAEALAIAPGYRSGSGTSGRPTPVLT